MPLILACATSALAAYCHGKVCSCVADGLICSGICGNVALVPLKPVMMAAQPKRTAQSEPHQRGCAHNGTRAPGPIVLIVLFAMLVGGVGAIARSAKRRTGRWGFSG